MVAESIRLYGSRFWAVIPLGVPLAAEHVVGLHRSSFVQMLLFWAFGPLLTAAYVYACTLTVAERPPRRTLVSAYLAGLVVFLPFPLLLRIYVLPALALFGLFDPFELEPRTEKGLEEEAEGDVARADSDPYSGRS